METLFKQRFHLKPPLENQGSDQFLGKLFKDIAKGTLGFYPLTKIQPYLPEVEPQRSKKRKAEESDEDEDPPSSWESWRHRLLVWRTSLLMVITAHPHHGHLQVDQSDLEAFYAFLDGPEISRRSPPPSLTVIMRAERAAWRRISILLHEGKPLREALQLIRQDSLFWIREVYEMIGNRHPPQLQLPPRKAQRTASDAPAGSQPASAPKAKSAGKGKSKPRFDLSKWATHDSHQVEICRNYIVNFGTCRSGEKCKRSHVCPWILPDGSTCGGNHVASACPKH
eukprot:4861522-Amphidinium_carterae.1